MHGHTQYQEKAIQFNSHIDWIIKKDLYFFKLIMQETGLAPIIEQYYTKSLQGKKIYKDQCVRCFVQPTHEHGLFICMKCFNGFCHHHMQEHTSNHKHPLYLNISMIPIVKEQSLQITKLAIGVQGGALGQTEYETKYTLWCGFTNKPHLQGQKALQAQIKSLINTDSPYKKQSLASWEVQVITCEHTLTLHQEIVNKNLEHCSSCQLSTNLWLCLTCGNTGCGRKNWDGTGGNNHAISHFEQTGHPVVVKLGTITAEGSASLYCYSCNNEVRDEFLTEHLTCIGIEIKNQRKTQKTVQEINLELNLNFSLSKLLQENENQYRVYGPSFTGMNNIGNSCYLNSVVQTLNSLPEFQQQYFQKGVQHIKNCKKIPSECFYCQISKISWGLSSGNYSQKKQKTYTINNIQTTQQYQEGIKPFDFKLLIAKDNAEFMSNRQQDALQYLQWIFDKLDKEEPFIGESTTKHFNFQSVNRLVCMNCQGYKMINTKTNQWKYPVPLPTQQDIELYYSQLQGRDSQTKKAKLCEDPQYHVTFKTCLNILKQGDTVAVQCQNCKSETVFSSRNYIASTPKYLLAIPNRFIVEKWVPKKLNALIQVQETLNIQQFLIHNAPAAGNLLNAPSKAQKFSAQNVQMLVAMGFSENAAKRALIQSKNDLQGASNWIMQNMDNYEINLPIKEQKKQQSFTINEEAIANMLQFGFSEEQIKVALIKNVSVNNNSQEAATEWLFNVDGDVSNDLALLEKLKPANQNGPAEYPKPSHTDYRLKAVIIHLGKSVHSGHYVAYIKTQKGWALFNDEKVTISNNPVLGKGYIYVYEGI